MKPSDALFGGTPEPQKPSIKGIDDPELAAAMDREIRKGLAELAESHADLVPGSEESITLHRQVLIDAAQRAAPLAFLDPDMRIVILDTYDPATSRVRVQIMLERAVEDDGTDAEQER